MICRQRMIDVLKDPAHIQRVFRAGTDAGNLLDRVFECMEKEMLGYEFITTGLLWQFVVLVMQQRLYTLDEKELGYGSKHSEQMKRVLRYICQNYANPITLVLLAKEAGMAPRYLCRVFGQVTGRTPIDYLNYYRVECAAELLCSTKDAITEVAFS